MNSTNKMAPKFMTPALVGRKTISTDTDSCSVFITPPDSAEISPVRTKRCTDPDDDVGLAKPVFLLDSDETSKLDIIKMLYEKSLITTVCKKVLESLSDLDLMRYAEIFI